MKPEWIEMDEARYEEVLGRSPGATFYHTRAWARIVTASFPSLEDHSGLLRVGEDLHAVPLFRWSRAGGLLRTLHSSFPFLYGGPLPGGVQAWEALGQRMARGAGSARLTGNPFAPQAPAAGGRAGSMRMPLDAQPDYTHILDLPESPATYWDQVLTTQKRNDIRRLTRKGVQVGLSDSPADIRAVHALYLKRMAGWTQRPGIIYPLRLYQQMMRAGGGAVRLYVARFEDTLIGGTFVCRYNGLVHYHAGYFEDQARHLRPNVLVQERIIRDAIEDGYRRYDMLPSAGIESVERFKESFGGRRAPLACWTKAGRLHRWAAHLKRATGIAQGKDQKQS